MRRRFLTSLGVLAIAVFCNVQSAFGGIFFHRRRGNAVPCEQPPRAAPSRGMTVAELARFLVILKGRINNAVPDEATRAQLDGVLERIMGEPNAIFAALGGLVDRNQLSADQVRDYFGGEVLDLSDELRRLRNR